LTSGRNFAASTETKETYNIGVCSYILRIDINVCEIQFSLFLSCVETSIYVVLISMLFCSIISIIYKFDHDAISWSTNGLDFNPLD